MGEETGNTIAEIMMKSKARGVQKTQLSSVLHLPAKTQVYDLGKHSSRECVCVCVCMWVVCGVLPVPICSPLSAGAPPHFCGKKKSVKFEVCTFRSCGLPQGGLLVLLSGGDSPQAQLGSAPGEISPHNPLLKSKAGQWISAAGMAHGKWSPPGAPGS